jgi:arylsulfatase
MVGQEMPAFDDDVWELYDGSKDWTQAHDLAKEMPEKLHELQRLFLIEATKYNVIPLDDRQVERANPEIAGRPALIRESQVCLQRAGHQRVRHRGHQARSSGHASGAHGVRL